MLKFRMVNIRIDEFAILSESLGSLDDMGVDFSFAFISSVRERRIGCRFELLFFGSKKNLLLKLAVICEFDVEEESWARLRMDGKVRVPKGFLQILAAQSVGVARGVFFCKTEGTPYSRLILPPVNTTEFIDADATFADMDPQS